MWFMKLLFGKKDTTLSDEASELLIHHQLKTEELERRIADLEKERRLQNLRAQGAVHDQS